MKRRIEISKGTPINVPVKTGGFVSRHSPHVVVISKTKQGVHVSKDKEHFRQTLERKNSAQKNLGILHNTIANTVTKQFTPDTTTLIENKTSDSILYETSRAQKHQEEKNPWGPLTLEHKALDKHAEETVKIFEKSLKSRINHTPISYPKPKTDFKKDPHQNYQQTANHTAVWKTVGVFGLLGLLVSSPLYGAKMFANASYLKEEISSRARAALQDVKKGNAAIATGNTELANLAFKDASNKLDRSYELLANFKSQTDIITAAIPSLGSKVKSAKNLSLAASESAKAVSLTFDAFNNKTFDATALPHIAAVLKTALPHVQAAKKAMNNIVIADLPTDLQEKVSLFNKAINEIEPAITTLESMVRTWNGILAQKSTQRIVLIFQNNAELRPTGGFWGSFAYVTIKKGKIEKIEVPGGGTYDLQGSLDRLVKPPTPLTLLKSRWEFQDANWFPDFRDSAKQAVWFLEHSGFATPDAIIAITPDVLRNMLAVTGPLEIPGFNKTVDAENATDILQVAVEQEYDKKENKPKKIIGALTDALLQKLSGLQSEDQLQVMESLYNALNSKDIVMFHQNQAAQKIISEAGWDGAMATWDNDYLAVINANIAGQKTDQVIKQYIDKKSTILEDGTVETVLTITRNHTGKKGDVFTGVRNVNFMRVYVPQNAILEDARGFTYPQESLFKAISTTSTMGLLAKIESTEEIEPLSGTIITTEHDKKVFGNWTITDPGESTTVKITYRTPKLLSKNSENIMRYTLLTQSQAGSKQTTFHHEIETPTNFTIKATTFTQTKPKETIQLSNDHVSGIVIQNKP